MRTKMVFKINHLGKVSSSFRLDGEILTEAKLKAIKEHVSIGYLIEQALRKYLNNKERDKQRDKSSGVQNKL
jgi:hypothetical protein